MLLLVESSSYGGRVHSPLSPPLAALRMTTRHPLRTALLASLSTLAVATTITPASAQPHSEPPAVKAATAVTMTPGASSTETSAPVRPVTATRPAPTSAHSSAQAPVHEPTPTASTPTPTKPAASKQAAVVELTEPPSKHTPTSKPVKRSTVVALHTPKPPRPAQNVASDCRKVRCVALTFDDGPAKHTGRLLDMLHRYRVPATFYVLGGSVRAKPSVVRRMVREGHEVGNHTYRHPALTKLSNSKIRSEMSRTDKAIRDAANVHAATMRPPYGARNKRTDRAVNRPVILWDVDTMDWKYRNTTSIMKRLRRQVRPGSIVLMHDLHGTSVNAVPSVVQYLKQRMYRFVTVSQLLATQNMRAGGVYTHGPRGTRPYTKPAPPAVVHKTHKQSFLLK